MICAPVSFTSSSLDESARKLTLIVGLFSVRVLPRVPEGLAKEEAGEPGARGSRRDGAAGAGGLSSRHCYAPVSGQRSVRAPANIRDRTGLRRGSKEQGTGNKEQAGIRVPALFPVPGCSFPHVRIHQHTSIIGHPAHPSPSGRGQVRSFANKNAHLARDPGRRDGTTLVPLDPSEEHSTL